MKRFALLLCMAGMLLLQPRGQAFAQGAQPATGDYGTGGGEDLRLVSPVKNKDGSVWHCAAPRAAQSKGSEAAAPKVSWLTRLMRFVTHLKW